MGLLLLYLLTAIGLSFLCSVLEAVLLSTPVSYVNMKLKEGDTSAALFMKYKQSVDRPISAILSLNTIAHTVGAAGVGAQAVEVFGEQYFGVISAVVTLMILIFSEIIPKTIGATYWRSLAMVTGRIIQVMIFLLFPLVWLSEFVTRIFSSRSENVSVSREEVSAMVSLGEEEGVFKLKESKIIQNLLKLEDFSAKDAMTPDVVVATADEGITLKEFYANKMYLKHSRIPVYSEDKDNIVGYVLRQTVFEYLAGDRFDLRLKDIKREICVFKDDTSLVRIWEALLEKKEQIALIVNEYGDFDGIVTMEDIIETLLGLEILDEKDKIADMQQYARERWKNRQSKYEHMFEN